MWYVVSPQALRSCFSLTRSSNKAEAAGSSGGEVVVEEALVARLARVEAAMRHDTVKQVRARTPSVSEPVGGSD